MNHLLAKILLVVGFGLTMAVPQTAHAHKRFCDTYWSHGKFCKVCYHHGDMVYKYCASYDHHGSDWNMWDSHHKGDHHHDKSHSSGGSF